MRSVMRRSGFRISSLPLSPGRGGKEGDGESEQQAPPPASKMEQLQESGQKAQAERNKGEKMDEFLEQDPEPHAKPW